MSEKTRLEELFEEHGEGVLCPAWEKIAAILCLERGNALRERGAARADVVRCFDLLAGVVQHVGLEAVDALYPELADLRYHLQSSGYLAPAEEG